jgi:hypothetical protein
MKFKSANGTSDSTPGRGIFSKHKRRSKSKKISIDLRGSTRVINGTSSEPGGSELSMALLTSSSTS